MTQASDSRKALRLPGAQVLPYTRLTLSANRVLYNTTTEIRGREYRGLSRLQRSNAVGGGLFRIRRARFGLAP